MAMNFWATGTAEHSGFGQDDHLRVATHREEGAAGWQDKGVCASSGLICPDTGKLTMHTTDDLRALLDQHRVGHVGPSPQVAPKTHTRKTFHRDEVVMLDDELHGPNGEYLSVDEVSDDKKTLTLHCYVTGTAFKRTADAVREDIWARRLKVLRYADPDVPPEWE